MGDLPPLLSRGATTIGLTLLGIGALVYAFLATASASQPASDGPILHCSWSLVDADDNTTDTFAPGTDDDPDTVPSAPGTPCTYDADSGHLAQPDGVTSMLQVRPDPDGASTSVGTVVAVSRPVGDGATESVTVTVTDAEGAIVADVAATSVPCVATEPSALLTSAGTAAGAAGAVAADAISNDAGLGIADRCAQGAVDLMLATWDVDPSMPCGSYRIDVTATNDSGTTSLGHEIDIACFWWLTIDFDSIGWTLDPGNTEVIDGDTDPTTGAAPTVSNSGNSPMEVGLELSPLSHADSDAQLDDFAASLGGEAVEFGDDVAWFETALCAVTDEALSLGLTVPVDAPEGQYTGDYTVWARSAPGASCDDVEVGG